jgi:hypothetical protein
LAVPRSLELFTKTVIPMLPTATSHTHSICKATSA